eukprot:scaffold42819_cov54-Phaeocystis_antarctica.AAC.4
MGMACGSVAASAATPKPWHDEAVARPRERGSTKPKMVSRRCTPMAPTRPVTSTADAVIAMRCSGVPSCSAIGIARATVTLRGAMARLRSAGSPSARPATHVKAIEAREASMAQPRTSAACLRLGVRLRVRVRVRVKVRVSVRVRVSACGAEHADRRSGSQR